LLGSVTRGLFVKILLLITEFNESGEGVFVDFILELANSRGIADFKEEIESSISDIKEAYAMD
jgi:hypothetical protein